MRVDEAQCEMIQAKCLERDMFWLESGKFNRIEFVYLEVCSNKKAIRHLYTLGLC